MISLQTHVSEIKGVGQTIANKLKKLDIERIEDLLYHLPYRYEDYSQTTLIENVAPEQYINIQGMVELIQNKRSPRKKLNITEAIVKDGTGRIKIIWFNQPFITGNIRIGDNISLAGKTEINQGSVVLNSPIYEKINKNKPIHTQGIIPIYHSTEGITQKQIRYLISKALPSIDNIQDQLPLFVKKTLDEKKFLPDLRSALYKIHSPENYEDINKAKNRLAFDELFFYHLKFQLIKKDVKSNRATPIPFQQEKTKQLVNNLPFRLTDAQRLCAWEILRDMEKETPMTRLLEGDVGSGKTVVASIAILNSALANKGKNGRQTALMAPTEILANQHFHSILSLLKDFPIKAALLTGSKKVTAECGQKPEIVNKNKLIEDIKQGEIDVVIGTHALIQEDVAFKDLALSIVDEQHRFGVEQRKALISKSETKTVPHLLSMTATPIPRSLALALFSDLDVSIIDEKPGGRKPVITKTVPPDKRGEAYEFIEKRLKEGKQVFVICPLIDASEKKEIKSVKQEYQKLNEQIFPDISIGILHGKLKSKEKEKVMKDFLEGKFQILVSTSVVEVGVDVPNATVMIIEGAENFGLSQLHQFRGRVGRGEDQSYCFLFTDSGNQKTTERLQSLVNTQDGFALAKEDLRLRGSGDIYGTAQKGFPQFKIASLFDHEIMKKAKEQAGQLIKKDPDFKQYPELKQKIEKEINKTHRE
ncbi:MAG: ATP-dependent DNA helicase RecG [Patescibacteria group bacterium]